MITDNCTIKTVTEMDLERGKEERKPGKCHLFTFNKHTRKLSLSIYTYKIVIFY